MEGLSGLASGVDTASIVDQLMQVEGRARTRMTWRQQQITDRQNDLTAVKTKLGALKTAAAALRDSSTWADKQTIESSDPKVVAERVSGAGPGGYTVEVLSIARAQQQTFDFQKPAAATTLTIKGVAIDLAAGATIDDAVAAINGKAGSPAYAAAVGGKLVLSARATGTDGSFTATSADATVLTNGAITKPAVNASFSIDGATPPTESSSNVVENALPGVRLTLKGVTTTDATVTVGAPGLDQDAVKTKVQAFVTAYNDLLRSTRSIVEEKRVANPGSASQFAAGALRGDSGLNQMLARLRVAMSDTLDDLGLAEGMDELREIGVSTGKATGAAASADAKAGLLTLDADALTKALTSDAAGARRMLGASGRPGFVQRLEGGLDGFVGSTGTLDARIAEQGRAMRTLQDQMAREDTRLAAKQARLKAQFAAMESALGQAQTQQSWLTGQLNALPSSSS